MPDPGGKRLVALQISLSAEEALAVSRWASEAGCPDIEDYLARFLSDTIAGRIRYEAWEKDLRDGKVDFDDELPF